MLLYILLPVLSYPIAHLIFKKAIELDVKHSDKRYNILSKVFYIPYINVMAYLIYLIWLVLTFKRPQ